MDRPRGTTGVTRGGSLKFALLLVVLASLLLPAGALAAETTIDSGPSGPTNDATPSFTFSSPDDPAATFECGIDGGGFSACSSPLTTPSLADGPHTFEVRAVDTAAVPDPTPASRSFTVDTAAPAVAITGGPSGPTNDPTPTFTFSSGDPSATFQCRIDPNTFATCGSGSHTTGSLPDGSYTFDVRAVDAAGNMSQASRSFAVDTAPPNTTIGSGPADSALTNDPTPTFTFSSGDSSATFECRIDSGAFNPCGSPRTTPSLADGPHTFAVRATDSAGNADPTPASRSFTVDTTAPDTTIGFGPDGPTSDDAPSFGVSTEPGASLQCRIDNEPFAGCGLPDGGGTYKTAQLPDGPHTFEARATDAAGNTDPTPASRSFRVDTTRPPDTTITKRPKGSVKTKQKRARVKVSFTGEAGATYDCKLDKGRYRPCKSPYSVTIRSKSGKGGKHRIAIRATDEAGNVGKPVVVRFKVLRTPRLQARVANGTVITALYRHGFAHRVVKAVRVDCQRRSRYAFRCRFSSRFRGYQLKGSGEVKLGAGLSYRFRVRAQGVRFLLTEANETAR